MSRKAQLLAAVAVVVVAVGAYTLIASKDRNTNGTTNETSDGSYSLRFERDLDDYTKWPPAIVVGRFTSQGSTEYGGDKTFIYTNLTFAVEEVLKGDVKAGEEITIKKYGGELDGERAIKDDGVQYRKGGLEVLFLGTNEDGNYVVFAGDLGQFPVAEDGTVTDFDGKTVSLETFTRVVADRVQ